MKKSKRIFFASIIVSLCLIGQTQAASSSQNPYSSSSSMTAPSSSYTKTIAPSAVPVGSAASMPLTSSAPAAMTAPTPPAPPVAPTAPAAAATSSLTVGDLTLSHMRASYKHDHIDVYLSIKNASTADEKISGADAGTLGSSIVLVTKDKSGKEEESPLSMNLTANKSTDFSSDETWIRIKDVKSEPKANSLVPLTLYFRRSPNAVLKITLSGGDESGSGLMDWLKK